MTAPGERDIDGSRRRLLHEVRCRLRRLEADAREIHAALSRCDIAEGQGGSDREASAGTPELAAGHTSCAASEKVCSPGTASVAAMAAAARPAAGRMPATPPAPRRNGSAGVEAGGGPRSVGVVRRAAGRRGRGAGRAGRGPRRVEVGRRTGRLRAAGRGARRPPQAAAGARRRLVPAWLVSLAVHGGLIVLLGALTIATARRDRPLLEASLLEPLDETLETAARIEVASPEPVAWDDGPPVQVVDPEPQVDPAAAPALAVEDRGATPPPGDAGDAGDMARTDAFVDALGTAVGSRQGKRKGDKGKRPGNGPSVTSFFGTRTRAERIVFLVDNSNSMGDGRFETALLELSKSIEMLSPKQSFHVVFYSDAVYRMFHPEPVSQLIPATKQNKQKVRRWLATAQMCLGGRLVDAVRAVGDLQPQPQVVYLLSDGVIGEYPLQYLTDRDAMNASLVIHTIGMTVPTPKAAQNLQAIAMAHRGDFRAVGVDPRARQLARRRPIRKNRHRGAVWGIKLPAP